MTEYLSASVINGTLKAVPSKSHAHRVLVAAALADAPCDVVCPAVSEDITATVRCLNALGADITRTADGFRVLPVREVAKGATLDCGESGTTLRFMLPVSCALGADAKFVGGGRLPLRPIGGLADTLEKHGVKPENIFVEYVPGTYELTFGAQRTAAHYRPDAVIVLGCVIQGDTPHFDYVCQGVTEGTTRLNATLDIPVIFGVLTTNNKQQALDRAGGKYGNKGDEAAVTAIKMAAFAARMK